MAKHNAVSPLLQKSTRPPFLKREGTHTVIASLVSIAIGMALGSVIIVLVAALNDSITMKSAWEGVRLVFFGIFSTGRNALGGLTFGFNAVSIGDMLFRATPLILTGLSVAVAFKTGLFNIGAPGQFLMGTAATLYVALSIPSERVPAALIWLLAFLAGAVAGALWGSIPGLLKSLLNINEVIACIMTNWIAANLVTWFFDAHNELKNAAESGKIGYVCKTSSNGVVTSKLFLDKIFPGSQVNGGILIAILIAVLVYIFMTKTTFGFELKTVGSNRYAAKYAGINDKRDIVISMAIAGALAGCAAALYYLSGNTEFYWSTYQTLPAVGFNGIPVALLAANNPLAVIFSGVFMSMLNISGLQIKNLTTYNEYLTDIIIAIIVYLSAFSLMIRMLISGQLKLFHKKQKTPPQAESPPDPADEESGKEASA